MKQLQKNSKMKSFRSKNHYFTIDQKGFTNIYLHGELTSDLYHTVIRASQGYMKINPVVCKETLMRLKDLRPGEKELIDIIDQVAANTDLKQYMIVFRR